jgi:hypothetical protein
VDVLTSERSSNGYFYLFAAAVATHHLHATKDDHQDRPRDADEACGQNADGSQEEVQADEDQKPRKRFVVRALTNQVLSRHFFFFHKKDQMLINFFSADLLR